MDLSPPSPRRRYKTYAALFLIFPKIGFMQRLGKIITPTEIVRLCQLPTIYSFGMNTQGALKKMAIKKFKNSWATKRKADWLKAQWVNETCRDLQAKVIKTAAFCHNRALRDLYPNSYQLLFTTGSITLSASPFSSEPDVQRVQRVCTEG